MSKKLIAVASASALALASLVGIAPAMATGPAATFSAGTNADSAGVTESDGTIASQPALIDVPDRNNLATSAASSASAATLATISVSNLATGDVVRFDATGPVRLVEGAIGASSAYNATTLGKTTFTKTLTNTTTPLMYAYTTSTTTGTVVVTVTRTGLSSSSTLHLKGEAGEVYKLTPVAGVPATLARAATSVVTFTAADVFGNLLESTATATTIDGFAKTNMGTVTYDASAKNYRSTMTSPSAGPFIASIIGTIADVSGFADSADNLVAVVNNTGVSAQIAALTASVAALTADYNKLAKRWNKRVASATAPKKRVALK